MKSQYFKAGMHLLETLTSGMYNDPLSIYREYIQNSVDSIDNLEDFDTEGVVQINLDPFKKNVVIRDNGKGISADNVQVVLSSVGCSGKFGTKQRGFRGIGRLGGLAFAKQVKFTTSCRGETTVSCQTWDCDKLRRILRSADNSDMSIEDIFIKVTDFEQYHIEEQFDDSFFQVDLIGVDSYRNILLDIEKIKKYLIQVSPLPFDDDNFSFSSQISDYLKDNVEDYKEYKIILNNELLTKPYNDVFEITGKSKKDSIVEVKFIKLSSSDKVIAHGWYGIRERMIGSIRKGENVSGIRLKYGNIQIGDQHILDRCFRENRFNSYIVGEIHACDDSLSPNSRRDDFVDNNNKALLYNLIEKEIGIILSKEIRSQSRLNSSAYSNFSSNVESIANDSISNEKKEHEKLCNDEDVYHGLDASERFALFKKILDNCGDCEKIREILKQYEN